MFEIIFINHFLGDFMSLILTKKYDFVSSKQEIIEFINENEKILEILDVLEEQLNYHFPDSKLSLEVCDGLSWSSESKLLVNVNVSEEMFFNGMLNHFNEIYDYISPLIEDMLCPVVLFPNLSNEKYDKFGRFSAINLIARTAYFNNDFDENFQREMVLREIPKEQQVKEIIEYCNSHKHPNISDMVFELQLDLFDVDRIIDELEEDGFNLNVTY